MSASQQDSLFPSLQGVEPPDTQIAVGPADVVEAVNDTLSVWSKNGSLLTDYNLNAFLTIPAGFTGWSNPRVLYDSASGRWFLSSFAIDGSNDSYAYLAVSATSDPTGAWYKYTVADNSTTGIFSDQPMIGVCDDKVVMSWNDQVMAGSTRVFMDAQTVVMQKSTLLTGSLNAYFVPRNYDAYRLVPAQSLSPTTTCWMTVNKAESNFPGGSSTSPTLGVIAVTGTPAANNVMLTETDVPIRVSSYAPEPRQPSGSTNDNQPDDRLLSAVWQGNELWTSATVACTPSGDTTTRSCLRLIEVSTSGTPSKLQDIDLSTKGLDEYYPAVSLDSSGDLFVAYSASSSSLDPGAYAVISPATSIGTFTAPITIAAGQAAYTGVRWGNYSAAAPDPSAPGVVWVAGEYATSDGAAPNWGTAAAEITLASQTNQAPAITSAGQVTFHAGTAGSFAVTATGSPAPSFSESGALPAGVTFSSSGTLSGTPAAGTGGRYPIQITASNGVGTPATQAFTLVVDVPGAPLPAAGVLGDVTGDGLADILAIGPSGSLWEYANTGSGDGGMFAGGRSQAGSGWNGYTLAAVAPLYGSARAGVLAIDPSGNLWYYPNTGGTGIATFGARSKVGSGWNAYYVVGVTDLYGTGARGILAMDASGSLWYYPNTGKTGTATFGARAKVGTGWNGYTADVADINGDGSSDLLAVDASGTMWLYPNTGGTGTATFGARTQVSSGWAGYLAVDVGQLAGTGPASILGIDPAGDLWYYPNTGTGAFGPPAEVGTGWTSYRIN
jgi:hypothetical protein